MNAPLHVPDRADPERLFVTLRAAELFADRYGLSRPHARAVVALALLRNVSPARALMELRQEVRRVRVVR
ncbi:hypothetical protein [Thermomonas haemolytica]|uniref:Uncharacterized protein n=1 Tax=Thermomonas haemolytica TaxID=141949 RepID=A0A4R3NFB6_9GAMM|nr:hypothetical protein [Thermomonas haemolytica]TCT25929.1 hypothetical protein EDC34_101255 [Thermomonas haemolytica]TNY29075.1 hypothetical protein BV505_07605 [Thermomonas haemolytica]